MKEAKEVVKLFKKQRKQVGNVQLYGIKVLLQAELDADKVSKYITQNYVQYDAHMKSENEPILSIWYHLAPCIDNKGGCVETMAEELVELFQNQRNDGNLKILSIKAILPKGVDADKVVKCVIKKYPKYKAHAKNQGEYPIVAIGFR